MSKPAKVHADESNSDANLVAVVSQGDLDGLGELFDRHAPNLRRYLVRLGVPWGDIDDLVQLTFLELVRAAPRFDERCAVRPWLIGIATTLVRRHRRSLARTAARLAAWAGFATSETTQTPADICEIDEQARRFADVLDKLTLKKREVFVLVTLQGLSGEEAAEVLGIPINTVWTRLHHARVELRAALKENAS